MLTRLLVLLLCLVAVSARADVTVTNYVGGQNTGAYQISRFDTNNNQLDAHDGGIIQVGTCPGGGCTLYKYGTSYGCGFIWQSVSPFCGMNIYTGSDMLGWTKQAQPFDPTTSYWINHCNGVSGGGGCGSSKIIYNPANNNYVWWINQYGSNTTLAANGMLVLTASTMAGPWTSAADPTHLVHANSGDFGVADDGSGNGYIAYSSLSAGRHVFVEAMNSAYTDSVGGTSADASGAVDEGADIFIKGGTTYVTYGPACGFCSAGVILSYSTASTPLGTYSGQTQLNPTSSCQSQPRRIDIITGGATVNYIAHQDQWNNTDNPGVANEYYQPLSFTGSAINTFTCQSSVTVVGLTATTPPTQSPTPDQTSLPGLFGAASNGYVSAIGGGQWRMQTFVPTKTTLSQVRIELAQSCNSGSGACASTIASTGTLSLVTVDGSNNPVTTLVSATLTAGTLSFSGQFLTIPLVQTGLTAGTPYGLVLSWPSSGTNVLAPFLYTYSSGSPYAAGVERFSSNSGASWSTDTGNAMMFSTFGPLPAGGRL